MSSHGRGSFRGLLHVWAGALGGLGLGDALYEDQPCALLRRAVAQAQQLGKGGVLGVIRPA